MSDVILYFWRYGGLYAERQKTVKDAVAIADEMSALGTGSAHGIESEDGWLTPSSEKWSVIRDEVWKAQEEAYERRTKKVMYFVKVQAPDDHWAYFGSGYSSLDEAIAAASQFTRARIHLDGVEDAIWELRKV